MFQLSLHHDLWTIELPEKRENCRCRGRANKAGIIVSTDYTDQSAVSMLVLGFQRITEDRSPVWANKSLIVFRSTGCTRVGTSSARGTRTKRRAAMRGCGSLRNS